MFDKIEKLGVDLNDIDETFVRGSGAGGQKINKTSNKVQMLHKRKASMSFKSKSDIENDN